jgi:hypothetical protein
MKLLFLVVLLALALVGMASAAGTANLDPVK